MVWCVAYRGACGVCVHICVACVCVWCVCGMFVVCIQVCGVCMWYICGMCMRGICVCGVCGRSVVCVWCVCGMYVLYVRVHVSAFTPSPTGSVSAENPH